MIEHNQSKKKYALKYIHKIECAKSRSTRNIFRERIILQQIQHSHILNLRYAFQDDEYLFFVLDLALGGDLKHNIRTEYGFDGYTLKVYACELSSALNYLHINQIIHRDLKPDNIVLDLEGHPYITDFNCSVSLKERIPDSEAGTLEYMGKLNLIIELTPLFVAPEMFARKQYKYSVDWWSLGVILYQCCYGISLFKEANSKMTIHSILTKPITFEANGVKATPNPARDDFLDSLLCRDVTKRLGSSNEGLGFKNDIVTHTWFEGIDWELVDTKQLLPLYIPKVNWILFNPNSKSKYSREKKLKELMVQRMIFYQ